MHHILDSITVRDILSTYFHITHDALEDGTVYSAMVENPSFGRIISLMESHMRHIYHTHDVSAHFESVIVDAHGKIRLIEVEMRGHVVREYSQWPHFYPRLIVEKVTLKELKFG